MLCPGRSLTALPFSTPITNTQNPQQSPAASSTGAFVRPFCQPQSSCSAQIPSSLPTHHQSTTDRLSSPTASPPDGTVIALIDPDFVFMRPLTAGVAREDGRPVLYTAPVSEGDLVDAVGPGQPVAQFYGIGDKWIEFNLTYIAGGAFRW